MSAVKSADASVRVQVYVPDANEIESPVSEVTGGAAS